QRRAHYDYDEEALRPYFPLPSVLAGMFDISQRLYSIRITPTSEFPTWHPDVQTFKVHDQEGNFVGGFYTDFYPRDNKRDGAWMNGLRTGIRSKDAWTPHLGLICANVTPAVGDAPPLLRHSEVEVLFHEFGHLLHHLLSEVEVRSLAGTNVAWDF